MKYMEPKQPADTQEIASLHGLEVVGLLDLGLPLLPHGFPQRVSGLGRLDVVLHGAVLLARQVDRLVLEGHLGG